MAAAPRSSGASPMSTSLTSRLPPLPTGLCALVAFALLAILQSWPLPLKLGTDLTGLPGSDAGAYVWNTWVFSHELRAGGHPLSTSMVLPLDGPTDLSLHNYTLFADILAVPLLPWFGVITTFNLIYLLNVTLAGFCMFLLARSVTGRPVESWIAGALFACAPFLVARSTAHFSLVAAAPLPLFVLCFMRAWRTRRLRDGLVTGAVVAWAAACDPYYAVYCLMLAVLLTVSRLVIVRIDSVGRAAALRVATNILIGLCAVVILTIQFLTPGVLRLGPLTVSMRTLYSPVMILTVLVCFRLWLAVRVQVRLRQPVHPGALLRSAAVASVGLIVLLSPQLYALGIRAAQGQLVSPPVLWRSSAPGVDLLAFFIPNPNHAWAPQWLINWIASQPGGFEEQVPSLSLVALAIMLFASVRWGWRPGRLWVAIAVGFGVLALGPFVRVAGVETLVPTPWALLRYVPGVSEARMPPRFAVVAMLGFCVLFAQALVAVGRRHEGRRKIILAAIAVLMLVELSPVPRTLYSARIPAVYQTIAKDARPGRVLQLPFGILDGLSALGNYSAASQFFQTAHGREVVGGYLSRVSSSTKDFYQSLPTADALLTLSEGRPLTTAEYSVALEMAEDFLRRAQLGYVVIESAEVSPELRRFAMQALRLTPIMQAEGLELWAPGGSSMTPERPCDGREPTVPRSSSLGSGGCGP
jgi:hypothetical protein